MYMEQATPKASGPEKESYMSLLSLLLIVLVLVVGAFYAWNRRVNSEKPQFAVPDTAASVLGATTASTSAQ